MTEPCSEFVVENVTSEHISRSLRLTLGGPRALGETLRCPELVLAQFWYDLGRSWAPLRGTWGHLGASCVPMLRSWGPLGLPWGSHGCSQGLICVDFLGKYSVFQRGHRRAIWRSLDSFGCISGALGQASCVIEGPCGRPWDIFGRFGDPLGCLWQPLEGLVVKK